MLEAIEIGVYGILQFLTWKQRLEVARGLCKSVQIAVGRKADLFKWMADRLLQEHFILIPETSLGNDAKFLSYFEHRSVIGCAHPQTRITSVKACGLLKTLRPVVSRPIESGELSDILSDSGQSSSSIPLHQRLRLVRRGSPPPRSVTPTPRGKGDSTHIISADLEKGAVLMKLPAVGLRPFVLHSLYARHSIFQSDSLYNDIVDFINGSSESVILCGASGMADSTFWDLLLVSLRQAVSLLSQKQASVRRGKYSWALDLSLKSVRGGEIVEVFKLRLTPDQSDMLGAVRETFEEAHASVAMSHERKSHLVFNAVLSHISKETVIHSNQLSLCSIACPGQSTTPQSIIINLDMLTLKNCLAALRLRRKYVPVQESCLTQLLGLSQCRQVTIVACITNDPGIKSNMHESVTGLRFAEQYAGVSRKTRDTVASDSFFPFLGGTCRASEGKPAPVDFQIVGLEDAVM